MNVKHLLISMALLLAVLGSPARGEDVDQRHIEITEIEVDPAQLDSYKAAVTARIDAAIRLKPGVLVLYSVSSKDSPARVTVFEIYRNRDGYLAHLQAPHLLKYKGSITSPRFPTYETRGDHGVEKMVKSLKLIPVDPVKLGATSG